MIQAILSNKILITVILAAALCQSIKIFLMWKIDKKPFHLADLIVTGGMPSTHSALIISLTTIIFLTERSNDFLSKTFILSFVLAVIVITDAMGVRRTAGEEGKAIERIAKKTKIRLSSHHFAMGHTPKQVLVGAILGLITAILVFLYS